MPYLGNEPAVAYTSTTKDTFSGDASTTDFTLSKSANVNAVRVVVENVVQNPTVAYTCSGTTLSFTSAPPTGTNNIYVVHLGPPAATIAPPSTINNPTTFTGGVTLKNETPEDTDGGRESIVTFQGTQSGSEISTLAQIQASHDATADDQKGDLIFKTNDGSDGSSPTTAMTIDSAQNVGIDFTPKTMNANVTSSLNVGSGTVFQRTKDTFVGSNMYYNASDVGKSISTGYGLAYLQDVTNGNHDWYTSAASAGSADATHSFTVPMRIDSSGNVGIRNGSPDTTLHVDCGAPSSADKTIAKFQSQSSRQIGFVWDDSKSTLGIATLTNHALAFHANGNSNEHMRISSGGDVFIGVSSLPANGSGGAAFRADSNGRKNLYLSTSSANNQGLVVFDNSNGTVGSITTNGSATAYNTSSDYRLKENVTDVTDGITRLKKLSPKRFNFIADADTTVDGFIAHEAATVIPEAVSGEKDAMMDEEYEVKAAVTDDDGNVVEEAVMGTRSVPDKQGIDQAKLVPLLTAALQEAIAKIETLETKVAALEAG